MAQNSGVRCDALDSETGEETTYFGFVEDIWELDYGNFRSLYFGVNGLKTNMSQWTTMGLEF